MLDEKKVKLMSEILLYEAGEGRETLKLRNIFGLKKKGVGILYDVVSGIMAYLAIVTLAYIGVGYNYIDFAENSSFSIIISVCTGVCGIIFVVVYAVIAGAIGKRRYENTRNNAGYYIGKKQQLGRMSAGLRKDPDAGDA
ncbi:MAG: hypothetical protein ACOX75_01620 [Lachnospiraceae bacterium]|jgi:hypothetical protein